MILSGVKVIEFAGLAPGPFAGMVLADYGADVIVIERTQSSMPRPPSLARGKRSIMLNLKDKEGIKVANRLCENADVLIEPFRPGVMEKFGLGPDELLKNNTKLIYARLTGFGQSGSYSKMAGHDINYLGMTGLLSKLGREGGKPTAPINLMADFAGGGLMCAMGVILALLERTKSGRGQVIDASMVDGASYIGSWIYQTKDAPYLWPIGDELGKNLLDTGSPFYDTYQTKDNKFMAVGAIEPQFYQQLINGLGLTDEDVPGQVDLDKWPETKNIFADVFRSKTQSEWCKVFDGVDACVTPVLTLEGAAQHSHNQTRKTFLTNEDGDAEPRPAPLLLRTPGVNYVKPNPVTGQHTEVVLKEVGYSQSEIDELIKNEVVKSEKVKSML